MSALWWGPETDSSLVMRLGNCHHQPTQSKASRRRPFHADAGPTSPALLAICIPSVS